MPSGILGVRKPLKGSVTGPSLLVNCYLEIKFHKKITQTVDSEAVNQRKPLNSPTFQIKQLVEIELCCFQGKN